MFLKSLSRFDFSDVCLGVGFTDTMFSGRTVGSSWLARPSFLAAGGICDFPRIAFQNHLYCFNSLFITIRLVSGNLFPFRMALVTILHELGHSFGSGHDNASVSNGCKEGNTMTPHTQNGKARSHFQFSRCSRQNISNVIKAKGSCLEKSFLPFCGNGLVEENEECDCGMVEDCLTRDACCTPRKSTLLRRNPDAWLKNSSPMKPFGASCRVARQKGISCHPSQGSCCTKHCNIRNMDHIALNCTKETETRPKGATCTEPSSGGPCGVLLGKDAATCISGTCHSIECTRLGLPECHCTFWSNKFCGTCCMSTGGECIPAVNLTQELLMTIKTNISDFKSALSTNNTYSNFWNKWKSLEKSYLNHWKPITAEVVNTRSKNYKYSNPKYNKVHGDEFITVLFIRKCFKAEHFHDCVTLAFRLWKTNATCVSEGRVGTCEKGGHCGLSKPRFGTVPALAITASSETCKISVTVFHMLLYSMLLVYS